MGARWATDQKLSLQVGRMPRPQQIGFCFEASGRRARFLVDTSPPGDLMLEMLGRHPLAQARLASLYAPRGWLITD